MAYIVELRRVDEKTADLAKRDQLHAAELVKKKECRAVEKQKAEDLQRHIDALKKERMELSSRNEECTDAHSRELQRANKLTASLAEQFQKHAAEVADWAKILADCESAKSSEVECRVRFEADCGRLHEQLKESRAKAEKAEATYQQLRDESTDSLRLRVDKCLRGFVI